MVRPKSLIVLLILPAFVLILRAQYAALREIGRPVLLLQKEYRGWWYLAKPGFHARKAV